MKVFHFKNEVRRMKVNKESILSVLEKLDKERYKINKIGFFGSFAREEATESSDIDIFVDFKDEANVFRNFFYIKYTKIKLLA